MRFLRHIPFCIAGIVLSPLLTFTSSAAPLPVRPKPFKTLSIQPRSKALLYDTPTLLAFSPNGKTLATGGENCALQFWDVATGRKKRLLSQRFDSTYAIKFSPNGRLLALGSSAFVGVALWDTQTGKKVRTLKEPYTKLKGEHVQDIVFSPDGKTLIANPRGKLQVWDVGSGRLIRRIESPKKQWSLTLSPDGKTLATCVILRQGKDGCDICGVQFWDVKTGKLNLKLSGSRASGGSPLTFSPDGRQLVTRLAEDDKPSSKPRQSFESSISQWYLQSGQFWARAAVKITANGGANPLAFSPDGRLLAVGHNNKTVTLYDGRIRRNPSYLPALQTLREGSDMVLALAFSPDGSLLATSSEPGKVRLWHVNR